MGRVKHLVSLLMGMLALPSKRVSCCQFRHWRGYSQRWQSREANSECVCVCYFDRFPLWSWGVMDNHSAKLLLFSTSPGYLPVVWLHETMLEWQIPNKFNLVSKVLEVWKQSRGSFIWSQTLKHYLTPILVEIFAVCPFYQKADNLP